MEASCTESGNRANDLTLRLLMARSFIHSTLSLEYKSTNEPSEP